MSAQGVWHRKVAPLCSRFVGIDISPKTHERALINLNAFPNVHLICGDFLTHEFPETFDIVYSSLTFMHIEQKQFAKKDRFSFKQKRNIRPVHR